MGRKKEQAKPLFTVKHDFYASLDAMAQEAINLVQVVEMALDHGAVDEKIAPIVRERLGKFKATLLSDDE